MSFRRPFPLFSLLFALFMLTACDDPKSTGAGKYGMMDTNIPEYAAVCQPKACSFNKIVPHQS